LFLAETEQWYETDAFYKIVKQFHDDHAREPEMREAKAVHEKFTNILQTALRAMDICHRLEYKGSSYEGIKVKKSPTDSDLEFDISVIMVGGDELDAIPVPEYPGYVTLVKKPPPVVLQSLVIDGEQLSEKIARQFLGALQKCINSSDEMKNRVTLRKHTLTATQMDVYTDSMKRIKLYSVDYVPCYEVDGKIYLVKPIFEGDTETWRQCLSMMEKKKLVGIDSDQGCRRQVIRVLKVIRNASNELQALSSFHFKMAAFYVIDEKKTKNNWAFDRLGVRVVDVLKKLEQFLASGTMPLYFLPSANLFEKLSPITIQNLKDRVHELCTSETKLIKLMQNYGKYSFLNNA